MPTRRCGGIEKDDPGADQRSVSGAKLRMTVANTNLTGVRAGDNAHDMGAAVADAPDAGRTP